VQASPSRALKPTSHWASSFPGVSVQANYLRNEYQVSLTTQTGQTFDILPKNEWLGSKTVTVPLVSLANFWRIAAAKTNAESYERTLAATKLIVECQAVRDYYQLLANVALVVAAETYLEVSRETCGNKPR